MPTRLIPRKEKFVSCSFQEEKVDKGAEKVLTLSALILLLLLAEETYVNRNQ